MKKLKRLIAIILCSSMLFLSACAQKPWNEGVIAFDPATFTNAQMLEDYDYAWQMLEENCPLLDVFARTEELDLNAVKKEWRSEVENIPNGDIDAFSSVLSKFSQTFHGVGHIGTIGADIYSVVFMEQQFFESDTQAQILDTPAVKSYYKYEMQQPWAQQKIAKRKSGSNDSASEEQTQEDIERVVNRGISMYLSQGTPIIKINTFDFGTRAAKDRAIEVLSDFCLENINSKDFVIDIRGNSGGNTEIWTKGLEPLFAGKKLPINTVGFYKDTQFNQDMWAQWPEDDKTTKIYSADDIKLVEQETQIELGRLNKQDVENCDKVAVQTEYLDYSKIKNPQRATFDGHIWLVTNKENYSSADSLALIAKDNELFTLVGNTTGGVGNIIASPANMMFYLPNCGKIFRFNAFYTLNKDGTCNEIVGTTPDIETELSEDALKVCLAEIEKRK